MILWISYKCLHFRIFRNQLKILIPIKKNILKYFGHIERGTDTKEMLNVEGNVDENRPRGRSPTRWSDQIKCITGLTLVEASHQARNRKPWATTVVKLILWCYFVL